MPFCPCIVFNPFFLCVPGSFFYLPIFVWIFFSTNSLSLEFLMFLIQFVEYFWKFNCCFYTLLLFSDLPQVFFLFPPLESVFCVNLVFCFDSSGFCQMFFNNSLAFHRCLLSVNLVPVCLWCQKYGSEWERENLCLRDLLFWLKGKVWSGSKQNK